MDAEGGKDDKQSNGNEAKPATERARFQRVDAHQWNICAEPG
jgi:hypothetical protein